MSGNVIGLPGLNKEISFEVSKDLKVSTRLEYNYENINHLIDEINYLKKELSRIKQAQKILVTEEVLIKEWDNEDDARWDRL